MRQFASDNRVPGRSPAGPALAPRLLGGVAALVLALAVVPAAFGSGAGAAPAPAATPAEGVTGAQAALAAASAARADAEARLADATARRSAIQAELEGLEAGAARITEDLARARAQMREYVVAAYIDGGASALAATTLDPTERAELAWHSQLVGSTTADAAEAVDHYNALRAANDPERAEASERLDHANAELEAARNDAVQAAAHERDAEAALAFERAAEAAEARAASVRAATGTDTSGVATGTDTSGVATGTDTSGVATGTDTSGVATGTGAAGQGSSRSTRPSAGATGSSSAASTAGVAGATAREAATLARIRHCESRGNYSIVSASGRYRGAYQFDRRTWAGVGGSGDPAAASPAEQDMRALILLRQRGTRPWPNCG